MNFVKMYFEIKRQRESIIAAVDKYGLVSIPKINDESYKFLVIVHLILSSQTKDVYTSETISELINRKILSCKDLDKLKKEEIIEIIKKVGFANKKTDYLQVFASEYKDKPMPITYEDVISIRGVGNKMAYLYLQFACDSISGIGVDTHVHRVSKRLGLDAKTADKCEIELQKMFDKSEWGKINHTLVGFGQEICRAVKPKCDECVVKHKCPSSRVKIEW